MPKLGEEQRSNFGWPTQDDIVALTDQKGEVKLQEIVYTKRYGAMSGIQFKFTNGIETPFFCTKSVEKVKSPDYKSEVFDH